jgi:hypothetical protein
VADKKKPSNQDVKTPRDFLDAVVRRFGSIELDLAANEPNVAYRWLGPGSSLGANDALEVDWMQFNRGGLSWLNPPYKLVLPWVKKCAEARRAGMKIALLVPAAVCTDWFIDYVIPYAYVFELTPRPFKTEVRDCVLALYTPEGYVGRETWTWK